MSSKGDGEASNWLQLLQLVLARQEAEMALGTNPQNPPTETPQMQNGLCRQLSWGDPKAPTRKPGSAAGPQLGLTALLSSIF